MFRPGALGGSEDTPGINSLALARGKCTLICIQRSSILSRVAPTLLSMSATRAMPATPGVRRPPRPITTNLLLVEGAFSRVLIARDVYLQGRVRSERRARVPAPSTGSGQALRLFQRRGLLPPHTQDNPKSQGPRRQDHGAVEKPQGWKASLALQYLAFSRLRLVLDHGGADLCGAGHGTNRAGRSVG